MKTKIGMITCLLALFLTAAASAADPVVVLSLKTKVDGRVLSTVEFSTCDRDPNVKMANCVQFVTVDGKKVATPARVLQRLDDLRRPFSYDSLSGGIRQPGRGGIMCMMAGPAMGAVLEARYLTYSADFRITADTMKPVLGVAGNCLFTEGYAPAEAAARENAQAAAAVLDTIREFAQAAP